MRQSQIWGRWFLVVWGCTVVFGLCCGVMIARAQPVTPSQVRLMVMFQGPGQDSSQTAENALIRTFQGYGYTVLDPEMVAQTRQRNTELLQRYEVEAAKRLGVLLRADIVISGALTTRVVDKTYEMLGGKKVTVSQADISAKAILVRSGKVLAAENASRRKPFDNTGNIALQAAAEELAGKLRQGIEQFLNRDTIDYRLSILNLNPRQSVALQDAMKRVPGVKQVSERSVSTDTLELAVSIEPQQDVTFKGGVAAQLERLGLGRFEMVAREGEAIYLRSPLLPAPPPTLTYQRGYRKSWAVVIGINAYQKWPKLEYAVNDAQSIGELMKKLGFDEVIKLLDGEATQKNILRVLGDDLKAKTQEEDRVFIFFAGHGQTEDLANGSKMGYIIPVEGELNNYYSAAISMRQLQDLSDRLRAKHIFYAMDSCFSGLLLRLRGSPDAYALTQTTAPVRQVLTAGGEGEQVTEVDGHGLFTRALIAGLQGVADLNRDQHITATELYQFLNSRVLEESHNQQNPVFGRLGTGQGEFVF